ncbi:MAG: MFS transporter [Pseudomonadales bacterium]|nr:MFS transporter [Pseudomonadales bacterium]MCP5216468.1 MFS transporter [Pseudomonadales bacterium]
MRLLVISLLALFLSLMLITAGNAYLLTLLGVRLGDTGINPLNVGLIMACYSIGFAVGALYAVPLVRRVGHIRTFSALASACAMAAASYPLIENIYVWAGLRAIGGFTVAGMLITIESWFSAVATNQNRATLFSFYLIASYSASAMAQLLVGVSGAGGAAPFVLATLLLIAAVIPLSLSRLQSPELEQETRMPLIRLWQIAPLGLTSAFCAGLLLGSFYALAPLFSKMTQLSTAEVSQLMFAAVTFAMLLAWPLGWICDRMQRSTIMLLVCLLAALFSMLSGLGTTWGFLLRALLASLVLGLSASIYSISVAITNDLVDSSERVAASSALMLSYGLGSILGPLGGSVLMEKISAAAFFYGFSLILILLALFIRYRQTQVSPLPVTEQAQFIAAVPENQVAVDFDPRYEHTPDIPIEALFPEETTLE